MWLPTEFKGKVIILGVKIDDISMDEAERKAEQFLCSAGQHQIFTPNPEICLKAEADERYRHVLNSSSLNLADGIGLQFGAKILNQQLKNRVAGSDFIKKLLELADKKICRVQVARRSDSLSSKEDITALINEKYPNIKLRVNDIDIKAPNDCDDVLNEIIAFAPEILFVSLGAPAQEFWINKYLKFFPIVRIAMGVGGSFDFLTEKIKRAPKIMRDLGVEWLYRLYKEPKRLKRIKNATADFLLACHRWSERIKNDFRMNALGVIINKDGKLLLIKNKRFKDHWQFPQGGIEAGETAEQAVIREISEEIGCDTKLLRIIRRMDETNKYVWPSYGQLLKGYKGQQQTAFVLEFNGNDSDIDMRKSSEAEDFKWVAKDDVLNELHRDRRQFAQDIIRHLD